MRQGVVRQSKVAELATSKTAQIEMLLKRWETPSEIKCPGSKPGVYVQMSHRSSGGVFPF